ncbi:MAG: carbamoyl phosphate synthase large subunit, partial [Pseudomonadota bacterium]
AGVILPKSGQVYIDLKKGDRSRAELLAQQLQASGYSVVAAPETAAFLEEQSVTVKSIEDITAVMTQIANHEIVMVFITVDEKRSAIQASQNIRKAALAARIPLYSTIAGAEAATLALKHLENYDVYAVQKLHISLQEPLKATL